MATRIWAGPPDAKLSDIQENVGPTGTSAIVALVVDLSATVSGGPGAASRTISKAEVLKTLEKIREAVINDKWPPA